MKHPPKGIVVVLAILLPFLIATPSTATTQAGPPQTVPALQQWSPGPVATTFTASSRIVVNAGSGMPLFADAHTFAADLGLATGTMPPVVTGVRSAANPGDIYLTLDPAVAVHNNEGYQLESGGFVAISGTTADGVFNGTRSLLQLLRHSPTVAGGIAVDWPAYPERGIRIDSVPRTFSSQWWHNLIRELSYTKLDMLQSLLLGGYGLTSAEITDITTFAAKYHVRFTPTLALSGHADPILDAHPTLELFDSTGARPATGRSLDYSKLDFTAPNVVQQLLDQYVARSGSDYFHVSGDEFIAYPGWTDGQWSKYPQLDTFAKQKVGPTATARDGYIWYLNWLDDQIEARGKKMRVWNDTIERSPLIALHSDIQVEFWYQPARAAGLTPTDITATNKLLNVREDLLYYDMAVRSVDPQKVYDLFVPTQFPGYTVPATNVSGGMIAVWLGAQGPQAALETNEQLLDRLRMPLRALAQKTWASPNPGTYANFAAIDPSVAVGVVPTAGVATGKAAWLPDGRFLVRTTAGELQFGAYAVDGMLRTTTIATGVSGDPVTVMAGSTPYFAIRAADGRLLYGSLQPTGWRLAYALTGVAGDPALALDSLGRVVYAARLSNGELWSGREDLAPERLTTGLVGDPVLIADANKKLTWFARTTGATVRHGWQSAAGGPWDPITAELVTGAAGQPVPALDANGKLTLFVRATNGDIVHRWQAVAGGGWDPTQAVLVNGAAGDPAVSLDSERKLTLFVRKTDGGLAHRWQSLAGGGWYPGEVVLLTGVASDPTVTLDSAGRLTLFVTTTDGNLWFRRQSVPAGGWANAELVFSGLSSLPAVRSSSGLVDYLAVTPYRYLVHGWQGANADGTNHWWRWIVMAS
ncbi:hexosaminidase [Kribbella aluminosa]|uniref:Hexosaminidase n=1 Tax=Kribbella aluminosa TaxID=416017 RepID=A0ABS4UIZ9_9ACTN|nr:glycoside hydrolase family 20 zincin-like fold domain-containing protein [Kribbella aluminosa]MBP2351635.1 hexosaminidase [Kribbella aluminosa]